MAIAREPEPTEPRRVKAFARFFKSYMSIWAIVVAALPIPVTLAGTIPTYAAQKGILATYTPLFCVLLLGFIFYARHSLARIMFGREFLLGIGGGRWLRQAAQEAFTVGLQRRGSQGCRRF